MMEVKVRLFGAFRKYGNGSELQLELSENSTVRDLRAALARKLTALDPGFRDQGLVEDSAFASEAEVLAETAALARGAVVAVLPPVCGG